MKCVKKLFVVVCVTMIAVLGIGSMTNVKATEEVAYTPWFLTFDDAFVRVKENQTNLFMLSNSFSITYDDQVDGTLGGHYWLWVEDGGVIPYYPYVENGYLAQGQTVNLPIAGKIIFEYELPDGTWETIGIQVHRTLEKRLYSNYVSGKYYYDHVTLYDTDYFRDPSTALQATVYTPSYSYVGGFNAFYFDEEGVYWVEVLDLLRYQTYYLDFYIDKTKPVIDLEEFIYGKEAIEILNNGTTYGGVKVTYSDDIGIASMNYRYVSTSGQVTVGNVPSGFTFWQKGSYTIQVVDLAGNVTEKSFYINSFDLLVDPHSGVTVGTEVLLNRGAYGATTMTAGYTRCIYLGVDSPSQSRLDYYFTSSNPAVATVSAFGTVTAHSAGTVRIKVVSKSNPAKVAVIDFTVSAR